MMNVGLSNSSLKDEELIALARKLQSKRNLQSLKIICLKVILNNCAQLSSSLASIPNSLKVECLEFLTKLAKEGRNPLSSEIKVQVINLLLNPAVREFDFEVVCPEGLSSSCKTIEYWSKAFDDLWTALAARCPHLQKVREMRPVGLVTSTHLMYLCYNLNYNAFKFPEMLCLETNCCINSDHINEIISKLKNLRRLKASYVIGQLLNISKLSLLGHLKVLHLDKIGQNYGLDHDEEASFQFNQILFRWMPKLELHLRSKFYEEGWLMLPEWITFKNGLNHLVPVKMEECSYEFDQEDTLAKLAEFMPNLRSLRLTTFHFETEILNPAHFLLLTNLSSLELFFSMFTIPILAAVGQQLKELKIWPGTHDTSLGPGLVNLFQMFAVCPNLEYFAMDSFGGTYEMNVGIARAKDLKLKRLTLCNFDTFQAPGLLPFLLSAPQLEEVKLGTYNISIGDVETLISLLSEEQIFRNVIKVDLGIVYEFPSSGSKPFQAALEKLATHIISFSPQLQTLTRFNSVKITCEGENHVEPNNTLAQCLALLERM